MRFRREFWRKSQCGDNEDYQGNVKMSKTLPISCANCGGQVAFPTGGTRAKCPYCGTDQILTGETARQVQQEGAPLCPVCKQNDRLEKVSAIVGKDSTAYPSKLAQWLRLSDLSHPEPETMAEESAFTPKNTLLTLNFFLIGFFALCAGFMALILRDFGADAGAWQVLGKLLALFLAALALVNILFKKDSDNKKESPIRLKPGLAEKQRADLRRQQRIEIWNKLYYCHRDDCVCLPGRGLYADVKETEAFVYAQQRQG